MPLPWLYVITTSLARPLCKVYEGNSLYTVALIHPALRMAYNRVRFVTLWIDTCAL